MKLFNCSILRLFNEKVKLFLKYSFNLSVSNISPFLPISSNLNSFDSFFSFKIEYIWNKFIYLSTFFDEPYLFEE